MTTTTAMQEFLDSLSQVPGSLLYRDRITWEALPPGAPGQKLTLSQDLIPKWGPYQTYSPAYQNLNGSTDYWTRVFTSTGNRVSVVARFRVQPFTGGGLRRLLDARGPGNGVRALVTLAATDHADPNRRDRLQVNSNTIASTSLALLLSKDPVTDNQHHVLTYTFNGDTGEATFTLNLQDADDLTNPNRVAPTTGALDAGANSQLWISSQFAGTNKWLGYLGYMGYHDRADIDPADFCSPEPWPLPIDHVTWTQWKTQPPLWHESAQFNQNRGSAGAATVNGSPRLADPLIWST